MDSILDKLNDLVEKELNKIVSKGDITPAELEIATKAVCLIEKIKMIAELEYDDSYASYNNGSYRRNRGYNSRDNYNVDRVRDYTMDRGYSGHSVRDRMIAQLESSMMDNAKSESERRTIESLISQLGSEKY